MRAPVHRARSEYADALRRCASVAPVELWSPQFVHMIIESPSTLEYTERMRAACFLFGNGCSANDVRAILLHRMRDKAARGNLEFGLASATLLDDGSLILVGNGGSVLRLKGKGFTRKNGTRGDQLVTLEIQLPEQLDELAERLDGWKDESDPRSKLGV